MWWQYPDDAMMKRWLIYIACWMSVGAVFADGTGTRLRVDCGDWVQLEATPYEDYHFVRWSDGNTEPLRQLQVNEDAAYIAYFAANCEEYANWPVVALYDWLLMLNVREINAMGYYVADSRVTWYRVVGEPDDMHGTSQKDDAPVGHGYYLTLAQNLQGTGDYYAVADVSDTKGMLCDGLMRSVIVHYANSSRTPRLYLTPNMVTGGEQMRIRGLDPMKTYTILVHSTTGQLVGEYTASGCEVYYLEAAGVAGCYQVSVVTDDMQTTLRYIVANP